MWESMCRKIEKWFSFLARARPTLAISQKRRIFNTLDTLYSFATFTPLRTPQIESILLLVYGQEMIMSILKTLTTGTLAVLAMASTLSAKDFSGAELYTNEEYTYGKFEARMKMAAASGTVSSMFLYQNGSEQASAQRWVEVDIEVLGKNPNSFQSNIITGKAGAQVTSEKHHSVSPAADQGFHTYGLEWTPDYVSWTLDGKEVRRTKKGDNKNQVENLIGTQGLRFNIWSSESAEWVGNFDESKLPLFQFINWVKVYKYTPGQGEGGSDFTLDWTDNFDSFDSGRWSKGNWTFDGNRVDLTPNNIYSKDGMLILALTRKGQENFNGQVPKDDEPAPVSSSSVTPPPESSSSSEPFIPPMSSSSEPITAIQQVRTPQMQPKEVRGIVNAKGAHVKEINRYRVNFKY
jgi:hypothetical protein